MACQVASAPNPCLAPAPPHQAHVAGAILLAPDSRAATWDYLNTATFGPDVAFINASMGAVFAKYRVDPTTLGIEGFSDGATYALILGTLLLEALPHMSVLSPHRPLCLHTGGHVHWPSPQLICLLTFASLALPASASAQQQNLLVAVSMTMPCLAPAATDQLCSLPSALQPTYGLCRHHQRRGV